MRFTKYTACGNDFVLIDDPDDSFALTPAAVRALCARRHGVGADGILRLTAPPRPDADVFMDYRNADGGVVEMCGNGVRCVATYLLTRRIAGDVVRVDTRAGVRPVRVTARDGQGRATATEVDMGVPVLTGRVSLDLPDADVAPGTDVARLAGADRRDGPGDPPSASVPSPAPVTAVTVSMGNPHAVLVVDDVAKAPVERWGPRIEHDAAFPRRTNVEFISAPDRTRVVGRIWERGVGETQASGSGASAMAVAAAQLGLVDRRVDVELPGGVLGVDWRRGPVLVRGPADEVYAGEVTDDWLRSAADA